MSGNRPRGGDYEDQQPLQHGGGNQSRGQGPRRGDGLARRGGPGGSRGGGGGRSFQSRPIKPDMQSVSSGTAAFSGSIDTWNNPAPETAAAAAPDRTAGSTAAVEPAPAGPKRMSRNSGGGKDAFDNAGNWGDDFPAADDWDNEEYTGSLADTKVFTARSGIGSGQPGKPATAAAAVAVRPPEQTQQPQGAQQQQQQQPQPAAASSSTVIGQNRSFSATVNGPPPAAVSASPGVPQTSSYSQSIDLSTLLQKPTTQSTLSSPPQQQQSLLQFNQQATDSLRAGLGIGPNSSNKAPGNLNSYSAYTNSASAFSSNQPSNSFGQGSAFTSIKSSQSPGSNNAPTNMQQRTSVPPQHAKGPAPSLGMPPASSSTQVRPRMPPSSKIPSSAVEMPGDNIGQLDVQFGGLDLKFGSGSTIGLSSAVTLPSSVPSMSMSTAASAMPSAAMPASSLTSVPMPSVTMAAKQISNGYQSSSTVLPKSAASSVTVKPGQQQQQQQHQSDSLGSYSNYGNYGQQQQQQSKPSYHHQYQNQYSGYSDQGSYQSSSTSGYGSQNSYSSSSTPSSGYKNSGNQYQQHDSLNKFDSMSSSTSSMAVNNAAAAVLGLTTTTNALSGKVSATTAGKLLEAYFASVSNKLVLAHR